MARATKQGTAAPADPQWSIARLLAEKYPDAPLRDRVRAHGFLGTVTVGEVLASPLSFDRFLQDFRMLPQCGQTQRDVLRDVLAAELRLREAQPAPPPVEFRRASRPRRVVDPPGPGTLRVSAEFFPDTVSAVEAVYGRMVLLAFATEFAYLPLTLPEFAKTEAVLKAEFGESSRIDPYFQRMAEFRRTLRVRGSAPACIFIDRQMLLAVFARLGRYSGLSEADLDEQAASLREMLANMPAQVETLVLDFERCRLSSASAIGDHVVLSLMGGYLAVRDPQLSAAALRRCAAAKPSGVALQSVLDTLWPAPQP